MGKQDAIQVIELVLRDSRCEASEGGVARLPFPIEALHANLRRALDPAPHTRHRQAAFPHPVGAALACPDDLWIDPDLERHWLCMLISLVLGSHAKTKDARPPSHLWCCNAYSTICIHSSLEHL
mmetsp:Transcript_76402/g.224121  ORF Transcript_76402/g.224121 Transcript_76402/m.224121 type:complete len:124 (+) Transcript_76402:155-526(+)